MVVNFITQEKIIFQGEFLSLTLPSIEGEICVLPNHAPLITPLKEGKVKIKTKQKELSFQIQKGILEINPKEVNILADLKNGVK